MIPNIQIDTRALSLEFDITKQDVDNLKESVVKTVTTVVDSSWRNQAKQNLNSTRNQYLNSIIVSEEGRFANTITLVGQLPNMIESGADPFDMKNGFEDSAKKTLTRGKDGSLGWYLTIPFTFAQPTSLGESQTFTGVLPNEVAKILNKKAKISPNKPLSLSDIPDEFKVPSKRAEVSLLDNSLVPEYTHKNSIYEGIKKVTQPSTNSSKVMSFRRVSNNSDSESWIHTGIRAYNLSDRAIEDADIPTVVGSVIDSFLDEIL